MEIGTTQTRREIMEQPNVLGRVVDNNWPLALEYAQAIRDAGVTNILVAARGTSDHAATYAKYLFGAHNRLLVGQAAPSLYTFYHRPPRLDRTLVIGISQSGASPDIVEVLADARSQGALTLAVTNTEGSALASAADLVLPCLAGPESAVAATKTYTAELACLALLSAALEGDPARRAELGAVPGAASEALMLQPQVSQAVERYRYMESCVVLSRGMNYATAQEIALKAKELAYVHTQPYSTADFMHGPLASLYEGYPLFAIVVSGAVYQSLYDSLKATLERLPELIVLSDTDEALKLSRHGLRLPSVPEWLSPIVAVIPGQWFALDLALTKGYDPDKPRAIHKVTVTR
ncbi:MAG: SIS domain-containing protein [Anaerolineae bacterium]